MKQLIKNRNELKSNFNSKIIFACNPTQTFFLRNEPYFHVYTIQICRSIIFSFIVSSFIHAICFIYKYIENRYKHEAMVDSEPVLFEILDTCPKVSEVDIHFLYAAFFCFLFTQNDSGWFFSGFFFLFCLRKITNYRIGLLRHSLVRFFWCVLIHIHSGIFYR